MNSHFVIGSKYVTRRYSEPKQARNGGRDPLVKNTDCTSLICQ